MTISDSCTDRALSDGEKATIRNGLYLYYLNHTGDVTCDRTIQYAFDRLQGGHIRFQTSLGVSGLWGDSHRGDPMATID